MLKATTRFLDQEKDIDARLAPSRNAPNGPARLDAYILAWGNYIPEIYGVIKALLSMVDTDQEAKEAWHDRMDALRDGCHAAILALHRDKRLRPDYQVSEATDLLLALISVANWEQLVKGGGWTQEQYIQHIQKAARHIFIAD